MQYETPSELEVDPMLIHHDLEGLHEQIRGVFVAARQAVNDELARLQAQAAPTVAPHAGVTNGHALGSGAATNETQEKSNGSRVRNDVAGSRAARPATANQVRATVAIARRQHADLEGLLRDEYRVERPEDLSLAQASAFIDQLKLVGDI